jgi:hypothetical protein
MLVTQMVLFREIHVLILLCWIGIFGTKAAYFHWTNWCCRRYSFQKLPQFSQEDNVLDTPACQTDVFCRDLHVFSTYLNRPLWNKMSLCPRWKLWCENSIPFKNELRSHRETIRLMLLLSIRDGFLWRHTCLSSTQLNWCNWKKESLSPLEKRMLQEVFLSETNSICTGNDFLDAPACNTKGFLSWNTCVSSTQLKRPV